MLNKADRIFLTHEREQRAQAQNESEIFETSSQPDLEEEVEEIEEQVEIEEVSIHIEQAVQNENVVTTENKQEQALELLKSAFEKINSALSLLHVQNSESQKIHAEIEVVSQSIASAATKKVAPVPVKSLAQKLKESTAPVATETVAPVPVKSVAQKLKESSAPVATEMVAPVPIKSDSAQKVKESCTQKIKELVSAPVATGSNPQKLLKKCSDEEFTIVLSKNSKKGKISQITTLSIPEKADDFPTLGTPSSASAIGFWRSGKDPVEIAKQVAKKPSPPPTRSPPLTTSGMRVEIRSKSRNSNHEEDEGFYDEDFSHHKQRHNDDDNDDTYWQ